MARRLPALALLVLPCLLLACGPDRVASDGGGSSDDGDEPIVHPNQPLPPIDLDDWCDDPETLAPFADQGPVYRLSQQGPCGHLLTWNHDGESRDWTLWHPDGSTESLGSAPGIETDEFSPTGRLLAWAEGESDDSIHRVTIRDLQTNATRTIDTQEYVYFKGFVRIPDSDPGAALWLCDDDVLTLIGVAPEDSRVLAEQVRCDTVSGAELTTRLVFADLDGVLNVVDAKDGTRWSTPIEDAGYPRLSPDGRLAFDYPDYSQGDWARVIDLDHGELLATCESLYFDQALIPDAPLFVACDQALSVWRDEALEFVVDDMIAHSVAPANDGSVTFRRKQTEHTEIHWIPAEDPTAAQLIASVPEAEFHSFERSANGQHGRLISHTSACANASCSKTITEVRPWTPEGLGAPMSMLEGWRLLHVFDDGQALGFGAPIEETLPEGSPLPETQLLLDGPDGTIANTWPVDGVANYADPLADGRLILKTTYGAQDHVLMFDREQPMLEPLLEFVDLDPQDRLDPRLGLLAHQIAVEGPDPNRLYWGAVPD